jgi:hypothetical protein
MNTLIFVELGQSDSALGRSDTHDKPRRAGSFFGTTHHAIRKMHPMFLKKGVFAH